LPGRTLGDRSRHRHQWQDKIISKTFQIEALLAGHDSGFGRGLHQSKYPCRDAIGERVDAGGDLAPFEIGRGAQRQDSGKAFQEPSEGAIVLPTWEMKCLEALGLRIGEDGLPRQVGAGADERDRMA
jgi:hypothetical protein